MKWDSLLVYRKFAGTGRCSAFSPGIFYRNIDFRAVTRITGALEQGAKQGALRWKSGPSGPRKAFPDFSGFSP
jgi:hypothetical protein